MLVGMASENSKNTNQILAHTFSHGTLDSIARSFRNSIMGGGSNVEGESLSCQLHFRSARKTKKNAPAQGSLKFREVSNSFWEGTRREKTRLKKVS